MTTTQLSGSADWGRSDLRILDSLEIARRYALDNVGYEPCKHVWRCVVLNKETGVEESVQAFYCLNCNEPNPEHPTYKAALEEIENG